MSNFFLKLLCISLAEDGRIIFLAASDFIESGELATFVLMKHSKVSEAKWQITERSELVVEHDAVSGSIHGLQSVGCIIGL